MFKVGDLVIAHYDIDYTITNRNNVCIVTEIINEHFMHVRLYKPNEAIRKVGEIKFNFHESVYNQEYQVKIRHFQLYKSKSVKSHLPKWW